MSNVYGLPMHPSGKVNFVINGTGQTYYSKNKPTEEDKAQVIKRRRIEDAQLAHEESKLTKEVWE